MGRAILFIGVRVLAVAVTAIGAGFDVTGTSLLGLSGDSLRLMAYVAFAVFFILTVFREVDIFLEPRPRIEYDGLSPARSTITYTGVDDGGHLRTDQGIGYYCRIAFKNKARNPSGDSSTAHAATASIAVIDEAGAEIDSWDGRWANNGEPKSFPNKWEADRLTLPANTQRAILDVGYRAHGVSTFQGWDNGRYFGAPARKLINPGSYYVRVTVAAANVKAKDWWFSLSIPADVQSDLAQIRLMVCQKPKTQDGASQLEPAL